MLAGDAHQPSDVEVYSATSYLLDLQNPDGGWAASGADESDPDTTAFVARALQAAGLMEGAVRQHVVQYLQQELAADGSYAYKGTTNCQTSGLALLAWAATNEDVPPELLQYVRSCQNSDGGFPHIKGGPSQVWATAEILQGLAAVG